MIHLGFFTSIALSMTSIPLTTLDTEYVKTDGVDLQSALVERVPPVMAAVEASSTRRLEQIFGGSVSSGSIGIFTTEELFFVDEKNGGDQRKQSFVIYCGYQYRVVDVADWMIQAGFRAYLAERHITQVQG